MLCCVAEQHQWEKHEVKRVWLPRVLRCFIIGENPGNTTSRYFYEVSESYEADPIGLRK